MPGVAVAPWITHDGGSIYSLDIHPNEEKIVTSGQADTGGDGLVVVWNLVPIKSLQAAKDENVPKMLAKIKHYAGVNCVRWSTDGRMFACASDDKTVTVYEYDGRVKSSGTIGNKSATTVEKYRLLHSIHSHAMEVMAVAWSPDGRYLASASMDDTIIVYNAKKLPEKVVVLDAKRSGHRGAVKGLAWDPIGKYLASQSADKSVKVWTTDDWKCEKTITEPYKTSAQTTMFFRLAWSAEGQYLFTPGAMNHEGPVAQIIRRKDWDLSRDFVGYRRAVTCVSVCPRMVNFSDGSDASIRVSLVAIGSRDKSLSVFAYPLVKRPLLVLTSLFKHSISDLSWRELDLAVCSQDGTIKYISFQEKSVGPLLCPSEMASECEKLYKTRPPQFGSGEDGESDPHNDSQFIETAEQLLAKRTADANKNKSQTEPLPTAALSQAKKQALMLAETRKEQIETKTNGKRRIQPIFLASVADDEPTAPTASVQAAPSSAPAAAPKKAEVSKPVVVKPKATKSTEKVREPPSKKERIETSTTETEESTSSDSSDEEMDTSEAETVKKLPSAKKMEGATTQTRIMAADFKKPAMRPFTVSRITVGDKETILDMPERRENFTEQVIGAPGESIAVDNEWKCVGVDASRVCLNRGDTMVWAVLVDPPVATAVANRILTAVGCFDRSVRIFASSSGRLHCCLQLDSSPVRVGINGGKVFALTQSGKFSSWDIEKRKAILSRVPVSDCVTKDDHLQSISITAFGLPVLSFSNGDVFTYASDLQVWQMADSPCSLMKLSRTIDSREIGDGHIGRALNRRRRFGPLPNTPVLVRNSISETQLEAWLNSAQSAGSSTDFRKFIVSYATLLVSNGSHLKIKELLTRLEGSGGLCGLQKAALRREVEAVLNQTSPSAPNSTQKKSVI